MHAVNLQRVPFGIFTNESLHCYAVKCYLRSCEKGKISLNCQIYQTTNEFIYTFINFQLWILEWKFVTKAMKSIENQRENRGSTIKISFINFRIELFWFHKKCLFIERLAQKMVELNPVNSPKLSQVYAKWTANNIQAGLVGVADVKSVQSRVKWKTMVEFIFLRESQSWLLPAPAHNFRLNESRSDF